MASKQQWWYEWIWESLEKRNHYRGNCISSLFPIGIFCESWCDFVEELCFLWVILGKVGKFCKFCDFKLWQLDF